MGPLYRIPRRFYPIYEEGKAAARLERLQNPDKRTAILTEMTARRKERERQEKILRTMQMAREYVASRTPTNRAPFPEAA